MAPIIPADASRQTAVCGPSIQVMLPLVNSTRRAPIARSVTGPDLQQLRWGHVVSSYSGQHDSAPGDRVPSAPEVERSQAGRWDGEPLIREQSAHGQPPAMVPTAGVSERLAPTNVWWDRVRWRTVVAATEFVLVVLVSAML